MTVQQAKAQIEQALSEYDDCSMSRPELLKFINALVDDVWSAGWMSAFDNEVEFEVQFEDEEDEG